MWPKPKVDKPVIMTLYSILHIRFSDGGYRTLQTKISNKREMIVPYKEFYGWYFGRPQSGSYALRWDGGLQAFDRKDVMSFTIETI